MVCHSDYKYRLQRLLLVICYLPDLSDGESVIVNAFISASIGRMAERGEGIVTMEWWLDGG